MFKVLRFSCLAFVLALAAPPHAHSEESMTRAVLTTRTLLNDAHRAMAGGQNVPALHSAINRAFAFDLWERFLIQDLEHAFDKKQRSEFRRLLPGFMVNLYITQFDRGLHAQPSVGQVRKVRRDYMVSTRFKRADGRDLPVEWRLREIPGQGALVIDMMVGGTSFLLLKREEFRAIVTKSDAEGLIAFMRRNAR